MIDPQIKHLQDEINLLKKQIRQLTTLTYRSEVSGGIVSYAFADLPSPNITGRLAFCTNCRRSDQGAGTGTGVFVVVALLAGVLIWVRVDDPTQVAAI